MLFRSRKSYDNLLGMRSTKCEVLAAILRDMDSATRKILAATFCCGLVVLLLAVSALCDPWYEERVLSNVPEGSIDLTVRTHAFF